MEHDCKRRSVGSGVSWEQEYVHGERFRGIRPANTLVRADLIGEEYLVEAVVGFAGSE